MEAGSAIGRLTRSDVVARLSVNIQMKQSLEQPSHLRCAPWNSENENDSLDPERRLIRARSMGRADRLTVRTRRFHVAQGPYNWIIHKMIHREFVCRESGGSRGLIACPTWPISRAS